MKRLLVLVLISSLFLTQCYTQNEYLTRDYEYSEGESITKIILDDSTVIDISEEQYRLEIISDTLILRHRKKGEQIGNETRYYSISDSIALQDIHSVVTSEYDSAKSFITIVGIGVAILLATPPGWYLILSNIK